MLQLFAPGFNFTGVEQVNGEVRNSLPDTPVSYLASVVGNDVSQIIPWLVFLHIRSGGYPTSDGTSRHLLACDVILFGG
jgi:hypothetical protein